MIINLVMKEPPILQDLHLLKILLDRYTRCESQPHIKQRTGGGNIAVLMERPLPNEHYFNLAEQHLNWMLYQSDSSGRCTGCHGWINKEKLWWVIFPIYLIPSRPHAEFAVIVLHLLNLIMKMMFIEQRELLAYVHLLSTLDSSVSF